MFVNPDTFMVGIMFYSSKDAPVGSFILFGRSQPTWKINSKWVAQQLNITTSLSSDLSYNPELRMFTAQFSPNPK